MDETWSFEHSVECAAPKSFAWQFWTTVTNWKLDNDVEDVEINGAFEAGTTGVTVSRRSGRIEWRIRSVEAPDKATIEIPLSEAVARFDWTFDDLGDHVRMTQRVTLEGPQASTYIPFVADELETGLPAGMAKLCEAIAAAR